MKKLLLLEFLICLQIIFSQETWLKATKLADSCSIVNYTGILQLGH